MKYYVLFQYDAFRTELPAERYGLYENAVKRFHGLVEFFPDRSIYIIEVCFTSVTIVARHTSNQLPPMR
jgi:hypothetical protein